MGEVLRVINRRSVVPKYRGSRGAVDRALRARNRLSDLRRPNFRNPFIPSHPSVSFALFVVRI